MRLWRNSGVAPEGKYLVVRRDATVPAWQWFVLGERDPAAPAALRAYAYAADRMGMDREYVVDIYAMADEWEKKLDETGPGDPDAAPHRKDDPVIIAAMRNRKLTTHKYSAD
jgi:hypothetical protein